MTGLSVLYAGEAAKERDWAALPGRDRMGRLHEVYWARRTKSKLGRKSLVNMTLSWQPARAHIGRRSDDPGDGFVYLVSLTPPVEARFEWLEVTEVFTTVPASRIEGAMRAWNGIPDRRPVNFEEFREGLRLERPSRTEQRSAADQVIGKVRAKLAKASYRGLLEKYGYGTLVVGMPLWFAVPPDDPHRVENAIDDFITRTKLGLEEIRREVLRRHDCPFRKVIVIWDTTPKALRQWRENRSAQYEDAADASLENPLGASLWGTMLDGLEEGMSKTATPQSKATSMSLYVYAETSKKALGKGPYPEFVKVLSDLLIQRNERPLGRWEALKSKLALALCKVLCFVRIHGVEGLERWVTRKLSVSHA